MSAEGPELLALALSLEAEGADDDEVTAALVEAARSSATALMSAHAHAQALALDMPYDAVSERTLGLLTRATQQAVHTSGQVPAEERFTLAELIVEVSGREAVGPGAVACAAEVDADLENLRATGGSEEPAAS